ncbi:terminase large subunit [Thioalkalivibrio sp. ALJ15]|uniref:terminase large subunit n=1 Tax=Thioalkalivibrio sp. ALJ15 TaxID=748652 RepID=UPI0003626344|nr:terminase TerL endonuclease subunit [Thioalkalivibrio sp. ALJ15]
MGLRGPGARPKKKRQQAEDAAPAEPPAWEAPGLSRAERVIAFIESLPVTSGVLAGTTMALRDWQREIIHGIYATDADGKRSVRTALLTLPRKNGKTGLAAGLALAHLCGPEAEARGQVYSAAADRDQAALLYTEMKAIIEQVPALDARIVTRDFTKSMEDLETGSHYKALSSDAKTKHGFSASCVIYDELAQAPNRNLYDVLATSTAARAEPLMCVISTQSPDPNHVMSELVDYAVQVRDGVVEDPAFYGVVYAAPEDADPWDEEVWHACNPALGDFRSLEEMRTSALQAQRIPARESAFRSLYLNQRVDADERFIAANDWAGCQGDLPDLKGARCFAGLDLSSTKDLTSLVLFFPDSGAVLPYFWCPGDSLDQREDQDRVPYRTWARAGHIEPTPGRAVDKRHVALRLADVVAQYDVRAIAFDRWGMEELRRILSEEGIEDLPLREFGQGYASMSPALAALEALVLEGDLLHAGHPVLTWNVANVVVDQDPAGNRKMTKGRARERIDGAVALAMAVGTWAKEPKAQRFELSGPMVMTV